MRLKAPTPKAAARPASKRSRRRVTALWLGGLALAIVVVPPALPPYWLNILTLALIFAILAVGLDLLMGYTGLDSLGQAAFFGASAYVLGILTVNHAWGWWSAAAVALVATVVLAALFGLLAVRLRGLYFLLITLALGQVLWSASVRWGDVTGGYNGLSGVPRPDGDLFLTPLNFAYVVIGLTVLVVIVARIIVSSPFGLGLRGVRDDEIRLRALGFRPFLQKHLAFVIAGFMAGIAGLLSAAYNNFVSPADLSLGLSFDAMLMVIIGGAGTIVGPLIGAGIISGLRYELSTYLEESWVIVLGLVYILATLYLPGGVVGLFRRLRPVRPVALDDVEEPEPEPEPEPELELALALDGAGAAVEPALAHGVNGAHADSGVSGNDGPVGRGKRERAPISTDGPPVLSLDGVTKRFGGFTAVNGVSFDVHRGERTAIIGPNGAGKTTLFNLITGVETPSSGTITLEGKDVTKAPAHTRPGLGLARTFQVIKLFSTLSVLDNMVLGLLGWRYRRYRYWMWLPTTRLRQLREVAREQLTTVGLWGHRDIEVRHLSYGHQRQLDLALALASRPSLLLLDEPTAGLSQSEAKRLLQIVQALPDEITIVIIEHNLDLLFELTDRLVVLEHGEVLADGPQQEVRGSEEVRRIYFGTTSVD